MARETHLNRPVVEELRELRDIACREHGAQARSTRRIQETLAEEEDRQRLQRDASEAGGMNQ